MEEAKKNKGAIYCLGEIVHNKQVVKKLEDLGIKTIENIEEAKEEVLIRAHGIPKEWYQIAKNKGIKVKDFTCHHVLKVHKIAQEYKEKDYFIFLLGKKEHPENIVTLSYCGKDFFIFEKEEELQEAMEAFQITGKNKLMLMAQTTYSLEKFEKIKKKIQEQVKEKIIFVAQNTICQTTRLRQEETEELAKKVDSMIIIGGKNSSNTRKLYEIAKKNCPNTFLIEEAKELELQKTFHKIGIMSGASTPKESIEEVINILKKKVK